MGPVFLRNDSLLSKAMIGSSCLSISDFLPSIVVIGQLNDLFEVRRLPFCWQVILVLGSLNTIDNKNRQTAKENRWFKWVLNHYKCNLCEKSEYRKHNLRIKQCLHPICSRKQDCHLWVNWQNIKCKQDLPFVHTILFQCRAWLVVSSC